MSESTKSFVLHQILQDWSSALASSIGISNGVVRLSADMDKNKFINKPLVIARHFADWWKNNRPTCDTPDVLIMFNKLVAMTGTTSPDLAKMLTRVRRCRKHVLELKFPEGGPTAPDGPIGPRGWRYNGREFHELDGGKAIEIMISMADKKDGFKIAIREDSPKKLAQRIRENCRIIGLPWTVGVKNKVYLQRKKGTKTGS